MTSETVLYNITGNRNLANIHVDEIAAIVKEYPFFSPAQFLLALKQKRDSSYNYQYQLQKTSLYFSNQAWLHYLITEKEVAIPDLQLVDIFPIIETPQVIEEENIFPTSLLGSNDFLNNSSVQIDDLQNQPLINLEEFQYTSEKKTDPFDYHSLFSNRENTIEVPTLDVVKQIYQGKNSEVETPIETEPAIFETNNIESISINPFEIEVPYFPNILDEPIAEIPKHKIPSFSFGKSLDNQIDGNFENLDDEIEGNRQHKVSEDLENVNKLSVENLNPILNSDSKKEIASIYVSMPFGHNHEELFEEDSKKTANKEIGLEGIVNNVLQIENQQENMSLVEAITAKKLEEKLAEKLANEALLLKDTHLIHEEKKEVEKEIATIVPNKIPTYSFKGFNDALTINQNSKHSLSDAVSISEAYASKNTEEEADNTEYVNNISSIISNQVEDYKKPIEENAKLEFENEHHHHTIDYFASQGIKIDLTKVKQDKLTLQMRRFTDWLKQIKKQDPNPQDLGTDPELEKAIMSIAKTSIEAREIVTETMADVFIKQGKVNKAIQLYIKLSFLDPQKSTYFANKIQQLKGI